MKTIILLFIIILIFGFFFPIIPFPVKNGWHGVGGEFCGIMYQPECDKVGIRFLTFKEIQEVVQNKAY